MGPTTLEALEALADGKWTSLRWSLVQPARDAIGHGWATYLFTANGGGEFFRITPAGLDRLVESQARSKERHLTGGRDNG